MDEKKFEFPSDPEVKWAAGITLVSLLFLVIVSRVFRDVNAS